MSDNRLMPLLFVRIRLKQNVPVAPSKADSRLQMLVAAAAATTTQYELTKRLNI